MELKLNNTQGGGGVTISKKTFNCLNDTEKQESDKRLFVKIFQSEELARTKLIKNKNGFYELSAIHPQRCGGKGRN